MFNILQFYEAGKARSGVALIPFVDTLTATLIISTRIGNLLVKWGDGSEINITPPKLLDFTSIPTGLIASKTYASIFEGNIQIVAKNGLKDIYSIDLSFSAASDNRNKYNIQDFGVFIKQFNNLFSYKINIYTAGNASRRPIIKGNLIDVPLLLESIYLDDVDVLNPITDVYVNLNALTTSHQLKRFFKSLGAGLVNITLLGDLGKLPSTCNFFYFGNSAPMSAITYTQGKVWASAFDTLYLPIPLGVFENDNLLNDLKNSITTAIGGKTIYLGGVGSYRTSASDLAVTYLTGLGFTVSGVTKITATKILDLPLQNNFTDYSASGISMVAGNANGLPSFVSDGSGGYAVNFDGTKTIKTAVNLPINSDKVTVEFDIKGNIGMVMELSSNSGSKQAFYIAHASTTLLRFGNRAPDNTKDVTTDSNWHNFKMVIDRALSATDEVKIYKDGILTGTVVNSGNTTGNFISDTLFIGGRGGVGDLVTLMKNLKIYNYPA